MIKGVTSMKNRLFSLLTALGLALSLWAPAAWAAGDEDTMLETIQALGILSGNETGDMNLTSSVTRAEFVKMMTAASTYKDSVGGSTSASLFTDVKQGHWAGGYIKLAVEQGWVSGYVDGSFRPDSTITLEEACTALLRLLGYDSSSLAGSYPDAQLSKARAVGLLDDLNASQGQTLTRRDCVILFYHLLTAENSSGTVYGTTLGYTITNGEVDYSSLITNDTKGPYISSTGTVSLPFSAENMTVYRNGTQSDLSAIKQYDVYYYNENLRTVWIYSDRVTGTLTGVSPSRAAPTSVTVAGAEYSIGTSTATYKLSSQGSFADGDTVTLLLGMNGEVVDVLSASVSSASYYGVVLSSEKSASTSNTTTSENASIQVVTQVACTDGVARTFYHEGSALRTGRVVSITINGNGTAIKSLSDKSLSGRVNASGTTFAGYSFAENVDILDTDSEGGYAYLYPDRLSGTELERSDVRYYTLDENGDIDCLILNEATGDTLDYVYVISASELNSDMNVTGTYQYLLNGNLQSISGSTVYNISVGGAALLYDNSSIQSIRQLESVSLTDLTEFSAMSGNQRYLLDEAVQVYLRDSSGDLYATTLSQVIGSDYTLRGWYDDLGYAAGGRIRILIATDY